ncbi:Eukaryotic translation initiation factor 3 subunit G [Spironucleus salmonicida]|uniref:Eukaryotic translation initiation factor 3 subunit G n=1 Tax=Spironucleus salmonicida TaxID=348837 RepID=V6LG94_9EUKA|nr:Eukaryotic translation initiation factor 3 subunit G [Spironucleus salmonicida]|eukprot:EST43547.1 Eukaryotic translation initiation factor 3 subunit G [Spironucleus salmonicida]
MAYVPGQIYRPTKNLTLKTEIDKEGFYTETQYTYFEKGDEDVKTQVVTNQLIQSQVMLSSAAIRRYNARQHELTNATNPQPPEQDFLAPNEVRVQINRQHVKNSSTTIQCQICRGPHISQDCPVKDILQKKQIKGEIVYSCKIEPIPMGWERPELQKFLDGRFQAVQKHVNKLQQDKISAITQGHENEEKNIEKQLVELRKVMIGYPPKNLFIREDNKDKRWRFAFAHFITEEAAKMCEKSIQKIEIVGENTFLYAMYTGAREFK